MEHLEVNKKQINNKKNSAQLLGITLLIAIAGIAVKLIIQPDPVDNNIITVAGEPSRMPTVEISPQPTTNIPETASGSELVKVEDGFILCGPIDSNRTGVIDNEDIEDFKKVYMQKCMQNSLVSNDSCGMKDFNEDLSIDIYDFVNFINKIRDKSCI